MASGLFLDLGEAEFLAIPRAPTQSDALYALDTLRELFAEVRFADASPESWDCGSPSESVALSAILTAIARPAMPTAPMHAITTTVFGSGKSYLADLIATIATDGTVAPIAAGPHDEELEKRLAAAVMAGASFISLDNVDREVNGALLNQMVTQEKVSPRRLGKSENVEVSNTAFLMMNANNLAIPADMVRRTLLVQPRRAS